MPPPDVSHILQAIQSGDVRAADELLPRVYDELRKLAAARMAGEPSGHTLQPTALVHEAYLRLVGKGDPGWQNRGHFFAAAAEAMRRVLVDHARARQADKRGGARRHVPLQAAGDVPHADADDLLMLDDTLRELAERDALGARLVEMRYFAGMSVEEAAAAAGISAATAYRHWSFARAWIHTKMGRTNLPAEK